MAGQGAVLRQLPLVLLILGTVCLRGTLLQQPPRAAGEHRKPFFERFRRLEEQFRRFQEVTLTRLQEIAGNYNISYNIDARFEHLLSLQGSLQSSANETHAALRGELSQLTSWVKKLQNRTKKLEGRVGALEDTLHKGERERAAEKPGRQAVLANLTQEVAGQKEAAQGLLAGQGALQRALETLQEALKSQGTKLDELEQQQQQQQQQQLKSPLHNEVLLPRPPLVAAAAAAAHLLSQAAAQEKEPEAAGGQSPTLKKLHAKRRQRKKLQQQNSHLLAQSRSRTLQQSGSLPGQAAAPLQDAEPGAPPPLPELQALKQEHPVTVPASEEEELPKVPRKPGTICNVGSMLLFPPASTTENFAAVATGFRASLLELSLCSWVRTSASYVGTILSYATEENDNKLVLHGRDAAPRTSVHFVIGDPAFRELPVGRLLDGQWHHLCAIWSSIQGRYWFYVDRRLASVGSRFQKGYEIPPGGSLVLGQEQDTVGGGFEPSEAFVGLLAGFAMWDRALTPGEVSAIATGQGLPRGPILTLANVSTLHGAVRKVDCACLQHCGE